MMKRGEWNNERADEWTDENENECVNMGFDMEAILEMEESCLIAL